MDLRISCRWRISWVQEHLSPGLCVQRDGPAGTGCVVAPWSPLKTFTPRKKMSLACGTPRQPIFRGKEPLLNFCTWLSCLVNQPRDSLSRASGNYVLQNQGPLPWSMWWSSHRGPHVEVVTLVPSPHITPWLRKAFRSLSKALPHPPFLLSK